MLKKTMKILITGIIFLSLLNLMSCTNGDSNFNNEESSEIDLVDFEINSTKPLLTTHIIDVKCEGRFVPLRNRILTNNELELSQKGDAKAKQLNDEVIIEKLYNNEWIKILKADTLGYHYVQVIDRINAWEMNEQRDIRGYIVAKYCNKPTVRKFERIHISEFDNTSNDAENLIDFLKYNVPNGDLLDYAYTYVSQEADVVQTFSFDVTGNNTIRYKLYHVLYPYDAVLFDGMAELHARYKKGEDEFAKYILNNHLGINFEIHINERDNTAELKLIDAHMFPLIEGDVIMNRIK